MLGIYQIPLKRIAFDTGFDKEMVEKILARFASDDKVHYCDNWIFIVNYLSYQSPNPNIKKAIDTSLKAVPQGIFERLSKASKGFQRLPKALNNLNLNLNLNSNLNTNSNISIVPTKVVTRQNYTTEDKRLTDLLMEKVTERFPYTKPYTEKQAAQAYYDMGLIHRRDNRPYELIEFLINWSHEDSFWRQNIRSVGALRRNFETLMVRAQSEWEERERRRPVVI